MENENKGLNVSIDNNNQDTHAFADVSLPLSPETPELDGLTPQPQNEALTSTLQKNTALLKRIKKSLEEEEDVLNLDEMIDPATLGDLTAQVAIASEEISTDEPISDEAGAALPDTASAGSATSSISPLFVGAGLLAGVALTSSSSGSSSSPLMPEPMDPTPVDPTPTDPTDIMEQDPNPGNPRQVEAESFVIRLVGTENEDVFEINAPNATRIEVVGDIKGSNDDVVFKINDVTAGSRDTRTITLITNIDGSNNKLVFDFADANDVVKLAADSDIRGFSKIEVKNGTLDLSGVNISGIIDIEVNSGVVLTLSQFKALASLVSVSGHGALTLELSSEAELAELEAYLATPNLTLIGFGADETGGVSIQINGEPVENAQVDAIIERIDVLSFPSIPQISGLIDALQQKIAALEATSGATATELASLNTAISALEADIDALKTVAEAVGETLQAQIATLSQKLTDDLAAAQTSLQANIDQVSNDLSSALNAAIADLQAQIDGLNTESATVADLSELAAQLAATQADLATLASLSVAGDAANADALASEVVSLNSALVAAQTQMQNKLDQAVASINVELANLQDQINALDGDEALELVLALQAAFVDAEAKIAVLEAFIASAEAADLASALESEVAALYAALSDNVATLNSSLNALQASLQANIDQVSNELSAALNAAIADLQAQINGLNTESATAADLSALAAQLAATQADLAKLASLSAAGDAANADALAAEVSSLNSALVAAQTQMQNKLDQAVASINVELANLQDQINALDGDEALELVLALQAAFADAEAKIAVLEAFIASAEAADLASALESEVAALYAALSDNV
ncbi:hypothetical protein DN062_16710, partial [Nitrincola tibetensis]